MPLPRRLLAPIAGLALAIGLLAAPAVPPSSAVAPTSSGAVAAGDPPTTQRSAQKSVHGPVEIVVRFKRKQDYGPRELEQDFPVRLVAPLLASRAIFRFEATDPGYADDDHDSRHLAEEISESSHVRYAEADSVIALADNRYHSWPKGKPRDLGRERSRFRQQPLVDKLRLGRVHRVAKGDGVVVAVLDTGVARRHRELERRLWSGYDYLADDGNPSEVRAGVDSNGNGQVDEAYGHGTFVAGLVALIAPRARILPMRVLDSDGMGTVFLVAQAVVEAVNRGADIVNLSAGTAERTHSRLLDQALQYARERGVQVVVAAGNANTDAEHYPATEKGVLSVSSSMLNKHQISEFANWGKWVDVAAPADRVRGPIPGNRYARWAGTSMAAPQVSAQLALLLSRTRAASGVGGDDGGDDGEDGEDVDVEEHVDAITKTARRVDGKQVKHGAVDILRSLKELVDG